ncbi:MAG: membrane-associated phospholipid phosphatase [Arcticibacterium sp.]|jgi:membrane-associated phospholipid phosphatase
MRVSFKLKLLFTAIVLSFALSSHAQSFDSRLVENWSTSRNFSNDNFFLGLSQSADYVAIGTPISLWAVGLVKGDKALKQKGIQSAMATLGTYGIAYLMKNSIKRERPFVTLTSITPIQFKDSYSMPSGSTSVAFASATSLVATFPKWYVAVPAYTYATAVGYSRIRSGEHYPTDVLAGAALGAGSVWVSGKLMKWINK